MSRVVQHYHLNTNRIYHQQYITGLLLLRVTEQSRHRYANTLVNIIQVMRDMVTARNEQTFYHHHFRYIVAVINRKTRH